MILVFLLLLSACGLCAPGEMAQGLLADSLFHEGQQRAHPADILGPYAILFNFLFNSTGDSTHYPGAKEMQTILQNKLVRWSRLTKATASEKSNECVDFDSAVGAVEVRYRALVTAHLDASPVRLVLETNCEQVKTSGVGMWAHLAAAAGVSGGGCRQQHDRCFSLARGVVRRELVHPRPVHRCRGVRCDVATALILTSYPPTGVSGLCAAHPAHRWPDDDLDLAVAVRLDGGRNSFQ